MDRPCPQCSVPLPEDARFCGECGASLAPLVGAPDDPLVGRTIGMYEIVRLVDQSTATYEARDPTGRSSVLWMLPLHTPLAALGRLEDEVRAQRTIEHAGLIPLRDLAIDGPLVAVATDLVDAAPLPLPSAPAPAPQVVSFALSLLEALGHAHGRGVVHADLGPGSIVQGEGRARLAGFGVARALAPSALPADPSCTAPERALGLGVVDHRADLYALGVLLYRLATGRFPFVGAPFAVLRGHVEDAPPSPHDLVPSIPVELEAVILKAMDKDPSRRWPDALSFADALRGGWRDGPTDSGLDRVGRLQRSLGETASDAERYALLIEIGDVWRGELEISQKALEAYVGALEARPGDPEAMLRLAATATTPKDWERALKAIDRVLARERNKGRRARHWCAIAAIHLDRLGNPDRAVEAFDRALDESHGELEALEAIGRILTERKDWVGLEHHYRKMLGRIEGEGATKLETMLWHLLGELLRTCAGRPDAAADAYEAAARLDPQNLERSAIIADLRGAMPGREADAIAAHERILESDPLRVESYRALRRLHAAAGRVDGAYCAAAVLAFLQKADSEELSLTLRHRPRGPLRPSARLDDERWIKDVFHPDEDVLVGKIFEALTGALRGIKVREPQAFGLDDKQRSDPATDTVALARTFGWAAQTLNLPLPRLYLQPDRPGRLVYAVSDPAASAAGSDLLTGHSPQELAFIVTRHLAYYRPEHYVRWILPRADDLRALLLAGLKLGAGSDPPADARVLATGLADAISESPVPIAMDLLRAACRRLLDTGRTVDVERWARAVDLTSCRAAFLLTGDLAVAARMIDAEPPGDAAPKDKVKEVLRFCASGAHLRLREALGVAVAPVARVA